MDAHDCSGQNSRENEITSLEERIADLKSRWPAHSVPAAMLQELDELEEELERVRGSSLRGQSIQTN